MKAPAGKRRTDRNGEEPQMEAQLMRTTSGSMLCLRDDRGTIIGWIPFPLAAAAFGPGRSKVYLARPVVANATAPAAASSYAAAEFRAA